MVEYRKSSHTLSRLSSNNVWVTKYRYHVLKGDITSHHLQQEFPELKKKYWGQHFWAIGYGVWSTGSITDEMVQ